MQTASKTGEEALPEDSTPASAAPLFRAEVMNERQSQWMGTVLLEPRITSTLFTLASILAAAAVLAFLFLGSYTRKARVDGWLVPEQGLVRIHVPHPGVVAGIYAHEGTQVKKGAPLLSVSSDVQSEAIGATAQEIVKRLTARRDSMLAAKRGQDDLYDRKAADLKQRLAAMEAQQQHLIAEIKLQRDRLRIGEEALDREREMRAKELITLTRLLRTEQEHLDQAGRLQALEREQSSLLSQLVELKGSLNELPILRSTAIAELDRNAAALDQELAEAEARRRTIIVAPQDGTVTAIMTEPGGNAVPATPLMSLVPAGSKLQAHLFGPSRSIGFVETGQRVSLRLQPFPYQRFGTYGGTIASISRSPVKPAELPEQLRGQTNAGDPVYRVIVNLDRQTAIAYGKPVPLQPGMQLEADVTIETRSLFEWILDPLYTLTGKIKA